jgi:PilZ domain
MGLGKISTLWQGNRSLNRLRLNAPASLEMANGTISCTIIDISATGARVKLAHPVIKGTGAILVFHALELYTSVMWCRSCECGLRFEFKLPQEDMKGMLWITQNRDEYEKMCRRKGKPDLAALGAQ